MTFTDHISKEIIDRYGDHQTTPAETFDVQTHVAVCEDCREKLARVTNPEKAYAAVYDNFALDSFADEPKHLPYERLESFFNNKLDEIDREIAESHLAICGECVKELADLQFYREIAPAPAAENVHFVATQKQSFWNRLFASASIGSLGSAATVLLVAFLFGAWLMRSDNRAEEIVQSNANQDLSPSNISLANSPLALNAAPDISSPPLPEIVAPVKIPATSETLYALNDGRLKVDDKGNIKGAENLSPDAQNAIKQSLQTGKLSIANHSLNGGGGVLMSEGDAESGVPFDLETPIGKVIRENRPLLRWKPSKDAASYSVAIVDDKFRVVEESGKLTRTFWQPSKPLPRGVNYSWQVTATSMDNTDTVSPSSPAPPARFRIIEQNLFDDISKMEKSAQTSHLALGVLYAKAGLKREARAEFERLVKKNPNSNTARRLLQSIK